MLSLGICGLFMSRCLVVGGDVSVKCREEIGRYDEVGGNII